MKRVAKNKRPATSLPPSVQKAAKSVPKEASPKKAEQKKMRVNLESLIEIRDRAVVSPEEIRIGAFGMSEKTRGIILADLGIKQEEYDGYLYGVRIFLDEKLSLGKVQVCDPKSKVLQTLTVAEA